MFEVVRSCFTRVHSLKRSFRLVVKKICIMIPFNLIALQYRARRSLTLILNVHLKIPAFFSISPAAPENSVAETELPVNSVPFSFRRFDANSTEIYQSTFFSLDHQHTNQHRQLQRHHRPRILSPLQLRPVLRCPSQSELCRMLREAPPQSKEKTAITKL